MRINPHRTFIFFIALACAIACKKKEDKDEEEAAEDEEEEVEEYDTTPPVLENLLFDFGTMTEGDRGDFVFEYMGRGSKPIYEFGYESDNGSTFDGMEFYMPLGTEIRSPMDGYVVSLYENENWPDHEMHLAATKDSSTIVVLDHFDALIEEGDKVSAGDVIGTISANSSQSNSYRVEFQIIEHNPEDSSEVTSHCPFTFFDDDSVEEYENLATQFMSEWEAYYDATASDDFAPEDLYDEESMDKPLCKGLEIEGGS